MGGFFNEFIGAFQRNSEMEDVYGLEPHSFSSEEMGLCY